MTPTPEERLPAGYLSREQRPSSYDDACQRACSGCRCRGVGFRATFHFHSSQCIAPSMEDYANGFRLHANAADLLLEQKDFTIGAQRDILSKVKQALDPGSLDTANEIAQRAAQLLEQKDREIRSLKISVEKLLRALTLRQRQGHQDGCDKIISSGVNDCDCGYDLAERALQWERNNG